MRIDRIFNRELKKNNNKKTTAITSKFQHLLCSLVYTRSAGQRAEKKQIRELIGRSFFYADVLFLFGAVKLRQQRLKPWKNKALIHAINNPYKNHAALI